jgi:N-acetylneuraminic acid mutarotase
MLLAIFFSCSKGFQNYNQNGNWVGRSPFAGIPIGEGAAFSINNGSSSLAYVGTGINPVTPNQKLTSMYKYTPSLINNSVYGYDSAVGSWSQVAAFPGQARSNAVGFTIGNTGYIGSGLANDGVTSLADFYSYNPSANTWSPIDSIHDDSTSYPRFDAVAFGFDTTAYVMTGTNQLYYFSDVWRYSPSANTWIQQRAFPGSERSGAVSFVYNGQGYIATGFTPGSKWSIGNYCYDFWLFTPMSDTSTVSWHRLRDIYNTQTATYDDGYANIIRKNGASFMILGQPDGDKGYITTGSNGNDMTFTWEYDFATDLWLEKTPYEGTARTGAVGFTLGTGAVGPTLVGNVPKIAGTSTTRGFIATGINQAYSAGFQDCEEFFPAQTYNAFD